MIHVSKCKRRWYAPKVSDNLSGVVVWKKDSHLQSGNLLYPVPGSTAYSQSVCKKIFSLLPWIPTACCSILFLGTANPWCSQKGGNVPELLLDNSAWREREKFPPDPCGHQARSCEAWDVITAPQCRQKVLRAKERLHNTFCSLWLWNTGKINRYFQKSTEPQDKNWSPWASRPLVPPVQPVLLPMSNLFLRL